MRGWVGAVSLVTTLVTTLVVGCGSTVTGTPVAESGYVAEASGAAADSCAPVSPPLSTIEAKRTGEPQLRIPQPPGWERSTKLDSELIRFAIVNTGLVTDGFAPNAVVTLERVPGTDVPPQRVLDEERRNLVALGGALDVRATPGTTCGLPSETVAYTLPGRGTVPAHPATVLIVVGPFGGDTYAATVTVQTTDPANPTYLTDSESILTGFQMVSRGS